MTDPMRMPSGNQRCMASPMIRPKAAPILNIGMRLPDGTGRVEAKTVRKNCKNKEALSAFVKSCGAIWSEAKQAQRRTLVPGHHLANTV